MLFSNMQILSKRNPFCFAVVSPSCIDNEDSHVTSGIINREEFVLTGVKEYLRIETKETQMPNINSQAGHERKYDYYYERERSHNEQYNLHVLNNFISFLKGQSLMKFLSNYPLILNQWVGVWVGKFKCSCLDMKTSIISYSSQPIKYPSTFYNFRKSLKLAFMPALICKGCTWLGSDSGEIILKGAS